MKLTNKNKQTIKILSIILIIFVIAIAICLFVVFNNSKKQAYNQGLKEGDKICLSTYGDLTAWAEELRNKQEECDTAKNNSQKYYDDWQTCSIEKGKCETELKTPDEYIFDLNFTKGEVNALIIVFGVTFGLSLFKIVIKDKTISWIIVLLHILLLILVLGMGYS